MEDNFLAEHVLPPISPNDNSVTGTSELSSDILTDRIDHMLLPITSHSREVTLNATNEHIELTSKFFNNAQFSDIRLHVGDNAYYAHKFILAKSSDVFATLLYSQHWIPIESKISLEEHDECQGRVFEKFLKFFYTAKVTLHESNVIGLLSLADKYNVESLRQLCTQYMVMKAKSPNVQNSIVWYPIAKQFALNDLRGVCINTVAWNMNCLLSNQNQWLRCDLDFIRDLLSTSSLIVSNEYYLYTSLSQWLLAHTSDSLMVSYACELLPLIRFPQMLPMQLHQVEQSPLYQSSISEQIRDLLKRCVYQAYRFHTLATLKRDIIRPEFIPLEWYLPRDYTETNITDRVDIQSTLRFGIQVDVQTCASPVPSIERTADWKVVYRKLNHDRWIMKIHKNNEAPEMLAQVTAIIYDCERRVLQVHRGETFVFTIFALYELEILLNNPYEAKELCLLIKPVIS